MTNLGYFLAALVAAAVAVFTMQNTAAVTVRLLVWRVADVPLSAVVLFALALGIVVVGLPLWVQGWRLRTRLRSLESRAVPPDDRPADT